MLRRVYQRALLLAAGALSLTACGRAPLESAAKSPLGTPSISEPEVYLAARSYDLVAARASPPGALATELGVDGSRAVWVGIDGGPPRPVLPAVLGGSRAVALFPHDERALVESLATPARPATLWAVTSNGVATPLRAEGAGRERFLGWSADGTAFRTAVSSADGSRELLLETSTANLLRRTLLAAPSGFEIAALDESARRVALIRQLDDDANELVVHDRQDGTSALLLPDDKDGHFLPQLFLSGDGLLLLADDGRDDLQLQRLDLSTRTRAPFGELPCPPRGAARLADGSILVELSCRGARTAVRLDPEGGRIDPPELPRGTRLAGLTLPPGSGRPWIETTGPEWTSDLAWVDDEAETRPETYGLPPRLEPDLLPSPQSLTVGANDLPAELWLPRGGASAGVLWLGPSTGEPDWNRFDPLLDALVGERLAVLRWRARGSTGFGRTLRRGAEGDPTAAAREDLEAARDELTRHLNGPARIALVGEGPWSAAVALVAAGSPEAHFVAIAALHPDPDPLRAEDRGAPADPGADGPPLRRSGGGEPSRSGAAALRDRWRFPIGAARAPLFVTLDPGDADGSSAIESARAAIVGGAPITLRIEPRSPTAHGLSGDSATALLRVLEQALRPPP